MVASPGGRAKRTRLVYEAAAMVPRLARWRPPELSPNAATLLDLTTLRNRSRQAVRDNGWAKGGIEKLVSNIVGGGIRPISKATDETFRRAVQALWNQWIKHSDANGVMPFYGQQCQAVRAWFEGGECFGRIRLRRPDIDPQPVAMVVELLEPELCPATYFGSAPNGDPIAAGIQFNAIGQRVAYWFYKTRPTDLYGWSYKDLVPIPASQIVHLYNPTRPGQFRGVPQMAQALVALRDLDKYMDGTMVRQDIANLYAMFVMPNADALGDADASNPMTGSAPDAIEQDTGRPIVSLEPGLSQELAPGEKVEFSKPPDPPATFQPFVETNLRAIANAMGLPYEVLTGNMANLQDRVVRVIIDDWRRSIGSLQDIVEFQFCRPIWNFFIDRIQQAGPLEIDAAAYDADPEPWRAVAWSPERFAYMHPVQDIQAAVSRMQAGLTTRSDEVAALGADSELIDEEQAADNARADRLGLKYTSDARVLAQKAAQGAGAAAGGA